MAVDRGLRGAADTQVREADRAPHGGALAEAVQALISYAESCGLTGPADRAWAYNAVLEAVGATGPEPDGGWLLEDSGTEGPRPDAPFDLEAALDVLAGAAVANGQAEDTAGGRDRMAMRVMGALTPRPSEVAARFEALRLEQGPRAATRYLYRLSCDADYVRRGAIARNVKWATPTRWGELEITINRSKPEKDPRDIAAAGAGTVSENAYPACQLCIENEGYPGRGAAAPGGAHPARQNLRIAPIGLGGERWGLQYSPYAYFDEHCIAMSARHRPMHIDRQAIACLLDFVDIFPHYFIGSNADLPVVGGSILSHDHFQGGAHEFPMMRAQTAEGFGMPGFGDVEGAVLEWPLSILRLRCTNRSRLLDACTHVIDVWHVYSDEEAGVIARSLDGVPHNTVTPVVRRVDAGGTADACLYEAYLALRCNVASDEHPLGVFHPHAELHHIKKENIGLIEVMGLAVLPARLMEELGAVEGHLLRAKEDGCRDSALASALASDPLSAAHADWALDVLARRRDELSATTVRGILREEVGAVFARVLEDAGVFKWDEAGRAAQQRFLAAL